MTSAESLSTLLYRNQWPDIPFPRILELKRLGETVVGMCPHPGRYTETRAEMINRGYGIAVETQKLMQQGVLTAGELKVLYRFCNEETSLSIADKGFLPALMAMSDDEQRELWGKLAKERRIVGCFALNEVGNGADFASIETTAEYDAESQQFVLRSPTAASVKWLIGALGKSATHALIFARTIVSGGDIGVHCFLTPVRDPVTLDPLPGIEVGDIGPKFGANYIDNGYLRLSNVRVSRRHMLAGGGEVDAVGKYVAKTGGTHGKGAAVAKVGMRVAVAATAWYHLARAITISIRYSGFRRQFRTYPTEPTKERLVIDYQSQSFRLVPIIAQVYAMNCGSGMLQRLSQQWATDTKSDGNKSALICALAAAVKAVYTQTAAELSEVCRECCGGHGFSSYSGLPVAYRDYLCTFSLGGDNSALVMEAAQQFLAIPVPSDFPLSYIQGDHITTGVEGSLANPKAQTDALRQCVRLRVKDLRQRVEKLQQEGVKLGKVWTREVQLRALRLVQMIVWEFSHNAMAEEVANAVDEATKEVLESVRNLFALSTLHTHRSALMGQRLITTLQAEDLLTVLLEAIAAVKVQRELLTDAFCLSDVELNSALAKKGSSPYDVLFQWASEHNPLNTAPVFPGLMHLRAKL